MTKAKKKKPTKELLDTSNVSLAIVAKFSIVEIKMKDDWRWKVKMLVHEILPKTHHDYAVKLEFDETPYQQTIKQLQRDLEDIDNKPTLLPDMDKKARKELEQRLKKANEDMERMRHDCVDIEFVAQSEEIKWKDGDTALLFRVLDTVIQPLNEQKFRLTEYRAVLEPILKGKQEDYE